MAEIESIRNDVSTKSIIIKAAIALSFGILVMLLPRPENLTPEGHRLLALLTTIVLLWVTEAVPIGVTALLAGAGLILLKIQTAQNAWAPFASPAVIVFGAGVSLGVSMLDSGAGKFLAEAFLPVLDGQPTFLVYYGFGFFGSFLSSLMSNSAAVALMLPITLPMAELMNMSPQSVAMLAPMTTSFIMLVIGCPPTIIAYSTGYFTQKDFIKIAVPWCLILLLICVVSIMFYWPLIGFI